MRPALPSFNAVRACRHGLMLYNVHDQFIGRSLALYGEFSEGEVDLWRQLVQPGQTVLDVGANLGAHTIFFARQVGPAGRVLAFEPQRILFQALCANMALNSIANVACFEQAVGSRPGHIVVPPINYGADANFGGLSLGGHATGEQVPVTTIDSLGLAQCGLMKIDVEGMEADVIRGATATIARCQPLLYVENDRSDRSEALIRLIDSLGYVMYWHTPPLYNPNNYFLNRENVFGEIVSINMLCVPRGLPLEVQGAKPVDVPSPPGAADAGGG